MKLYPNINLIFVIWLLSVYFISLAAFNLLPNSNLFQNDFLGSFANWDGGHYLGIAQYGYQEKFQYAFFPLYPILIKIVSLILKNYLFSALLISIICIFFTLQILYKMVADDFDKKFGEKVILYILFFPTSFYFITAYSESLFIFLAVAALYTLKKNKLLLATILISLASVTKISGLALVFVFLIYIQMSSGFNKKNWFALLSPIGFVLYSYFLFTSTGDPFYFLTAEKYWQRYITIPGISFWETIKVITSGSLSWDRFTLVLDLLFASFGAGMAIRSLRFLPPYFSFYTIFSIILPLLTSTLTSMPRFLVVIFPIFILIAMIKNRYFLLTYQIISLMLLALFISLFIKGYWVS